jgi:hypothetical protein
VWGDGAILQIDSYSVGAWNGGDSHRTVGVRERDISLIVDERAAGLCFSYFLIPYYVCGESAYLFTLVGVR